MNKELLEATKQASYLLWEYIQFEEPLTIWKCVEDIACYMESNGIIEEVRVLPILKTGVYDYAYIEFIRNIAYRIYFYTAQKLSTSNWYCAERLMNSSEWRMSICLLARLLNKGKFDSDFVACLHNEKIREYYASFSQTLN